MHKVSTINLNGRAYQLEDQAYHALRAYLDQAEKTLAGNPDKDEILADIEQAVAEKCDHVLQPGKNVVTTAQMKDILDGMGEVEAVEPTAGGNDFKKERYDNGQNGRPKRLFVIREGAMLLGVCQGLSAYSGLDVNIMRVIFIVLTFLTSGFWLLVYLVLGLFLPTAKTEADLAEAYGKPVTAQDIVDRAKERAPNNESLKRLSDAVIAVARMIAKVASVTAYILFGALTAIWLWIQVNLLWGNLAFQDELAFLNGWRQWLALLSVYVIIAAPIYGLARLLRRCAEAKKQQNNWQAVASETSLGLAWGVALVSIIGLTTSYAPDFRAYANNHGGQIHVGNNTVNIDMDKVCIGQSHCDWSDTSN